MTNRKEWLETLSDSQRADLEAAIQYVRENSQRQVSVLGWAQLNTPVAYNRYINRPNKEHGLKEFFGVKEGELFSYRDLFRKLEKVS